MTISAGILCNDGIVICADTRITDGNLKYDQSKVWKEGDYLLLTGSGTVDYMKMAFDKLSANLKITFPATPADAREMVESLIRSVYEEHILPFSAAGHYAASDLSLSLIVGIRCQNQELALIRTTLTGATLVEDYTCMGTGADVFKYWANYFLRRKMDMELAGYLCLFMVREAKKAVPGVGGETHVYKLVADPQKAKHKYSLWDDSEILGGFPQSTAKILFACADQRLDDGAFESELLDYIHRFRNLRHDLRKNSRDALNAINTQTITSSLPISIERKTDYT